MIQDSAPPASYVSDDFNYDDMGKGDFTSRVTGSEPPKLYIKAPRNFLWHNVSHGAGHRKRYD